MTTWAIVMPQSNVHDRWGRGKIPQILGLIAGAMILLLAGPPSPWGKLLARARVEEKPSGHPAQHTPVPRSGTPARDHASQDRKTAAYDLVSAALVRRTVGLLETLYLHPEDLEPATLLAAGVAGLARKAPDALWVEPRDDLPGAFMVGRRTLLLDLEAPRKLKDLPDVFSGIFAFYLQAREIDLEDVKAEYAVISGMLGALDRPTRLLVDNRLDAFNLRSRGTLSGIGCRIGRRQDEATVVEVLEGGPAAEVGLREGDRILRVDGESTVNMPIRDLVDRIRGPVGTQVTLDIRRGTSPPRDLTFTLTRRKIRLENVEVLMLPNQVGYLRITNFNDQTVHNFRERLAKLGDPAEMKGLVIDLRGNGGGSLKQSAFMVNQFVREGVIVRTEGRPDRELRGLVRKLQADERTAVGDVPIAVLVNGRTASGAEILAGALKYMDRAVVLGQRTFGKGTVQKVYRLRPNASVKMTVARYVLPGPHYIQSVGVEPDIELVPLVADEDQIRFREPTERDEERTSNHGNRAMVEGADSPVPMEEQGPRRRVYYFQPPATESSRPKEEVRWMDFEIRFAARLVAQAAGVARRDTLDRMGSFVDLVSAEEEKKIVAALATRGIDWALTSACRAWKRAGGEEEDTPPVSIGLQADVPGGVARAGQDVDLVVSVTNTGQRDLCRVRVLSECPDQLFGGLEFFFGRLGPGETREWRVTKSIPEGVAPGLRELTFRFLSERFDVDDAGEGRVFVEVGPGPRLEVEVTYVDEAPPGISGHRDRYVEPGDRVVLTMRVRNRGEGPSGQVDLSLKNPLRKDLELVDARAILEPLAPGEEGEATLTFDLKEVAGGGDPAAVVLRVRDRTHHVNLERELDFGQPWVGALHVVQPWLELETAVPTAPWDHPVFRLEGEARSPAGLQVITFYRGNDKVDRLLPVTMGEAPVLSSRFKASLELVPGPNRLTVICKDERGLSSRRQIWVTAASLR